MNSQILIYSIGYNLILSLSILILKRLQISSLGVPELAQGTIAPCEDQHAFPSPRTISTHIFMSILTGALGTVNASSTGGMCPDLAYANQCSPCTWNIPLGSRWYLLLLGQWEHRRCLIGLLGRKLPSSSKESTRREATKEPSFLLDDIVQNVKFGPDAAIAAAQKDASLRSISV